MKKRSFKPTLAVAAAILISVGVISFSDKVSAHEDAKEYEVAGVKLGGQLYDKWYKVLGVEVSGTHPLYPPEGKKSGDDTYRCKECHGWDYIGKDGRYRKGSHYTGIKGVYDARTKSAEELTRILTDPAGGHGMKELSADPANVRALVTFIREGLIDPDSVFNADGTVKGDPARGKPLYESVCAKCHGKDGNNLDFDKKDKGVQGVGWLARDNPQETLHKIRWGHPGSKMPSAVVDEGLKDSETVDLLKYSQTL
ncbi:MAG: cytochrome c [bacterium]|nr:MAG: cytochrome c [bacterium]